MTLYSAALFVHVVGAVLLFAALTLEGVALRLLRRASTGMQAASWAGLLRLNRGIGPLSAVAILVPGFYMTATSWGPAGWIIVGLAAWVLVAVLGAFSGIRIVALERDLRAAPGPLPPALQARMLDPRFPISWWARVGLALGVVFLMTVKPGTPGAIAAIAIATAVGLAVSAPAWTRGRTREPA